MLKTNYRCVQSPNISVDVAKCVETFNQFTLYTHFLSETKNVCVQSPNICVDVAKCGENFLKFTQYWLIICYKKMTFLDWTI